MARPALRRDDRAKYYPISHKVLENKQHLASLIDDLGTPRKEISSVLNGIPKSDAHESLKASNKTQLRAAGSSQQRVIGVSVTSSVEATPYKVRVKHIDVVPHDRLTIVSPSTTVATTSSPAQLVTEELSNIVSESNRSEFAVDEAAPRTTWRDRSAPVTPKTFASNEDNSAKEEKSEEDSVPSGSSSEPVEQSYEPAEVHVEPREHHEEPHEELPERVHQGRKAARHYDVSFHENQATAKDYSQPKIFGKPAKVYGEPEKIYSEPSKVYGEPAKVYGKPSKVYGESPKVYGEPSKVYGEPEKVYSEPSKVYGEPAKVYSEPAKIYSEPAKVYGEPSKIYSPNNGQSVVQVQHGEPEEQNYEVDEAVSVGSNGNVHGPQIVTESPSTEVEDGHKVSFYKF